MGSGRPGVPMSAQRLGIFFTHYRAWAGGNFSMPHQAELILAAQKQFNALSFHAPSWRYGHLQGPTYPDMTSPRGAPRETWKQSLSPKNHVFRSNKSRHGALGLIVG